MNFRSCTTLECRFIVNCPNVSPLFSSCSVFEQFLLTTLSTSHSQVWLRGLCFKRNIKVLNHFQGHPCTTWGTNLDHAACQEWAERQMLHNTNKTFLKLLQARKFHHVLPRRLSNLLDIWKSVLNRFRNLLCHCGGFFFPSFVDNQQNHAASRKN